MKTYTQLIEELCEATGIDHKAIQHHGHMMALYRTRNMLNPQKAARKEKDKHIEKLKKHGVEVSKYGGVKHPDADADKALKLGISHGVNAEYDAQPQYRHDTVRKSNKIRREVGDFTGLDAYRKATGKPD
tara:strand:- start:203 stop:592 length:390 start_codon:yes stop_codon:yes gene_type:complete